MKLLSFTQVLVVVATLPLAALAQSGGASPVVQPAATEAEGGMRVGVVDIDRIAAESVPGKALVERLKKETDKIREEQARREKEISDMQAKLGSEVLSPEARQDLNREIERKRIEAKRWLEDAQRDFQEKQQQAEMEFQKSLRPIVSEVATQNGFGLILRADPTLTMVLNPKLDITAAVIEAFNQAKAAPSGEPGPAAGLSSPR